MRKFLFRKGGSVAYLDYPGTSIQDRLGCITAADISLDVRSRVVVDRCLSSSNIVLS